MTTIRQATLALLFIAACPALAGDSDWPMWRADAARSGSSANPLPDKLSLLWHKNLGYPDSAFIHQARMCADAAYAPVAADGLLFVPSNLRDEVTALDLATGKLTWRFITGGPVRFAPVFANGMLYFGSDDGRLYCLEAATGKLLWKLAGAPDHVPNSKLLINGRLCSRWPVRGAPVLHDGKLFFGAGIWPEEGVYVSAVDAETGKLLWQTDALSLQVGGMNDHGNLYDLGLPPQGYIAVIDGKLAVASGRSLALFLDTETGGVDPYNCYYVKNNQPRGTWWLCGNDDYWIQAGSVLSTKPIDLAELPPEEMDLETFADYCGMPPAEVLTTLKKMNRRASAAAKRSFVGLDRVEITEKNGKTIIKAPLRSQAASGTFKEKQPSPAEIFAYRNRPILNSDVFRVHDEVGYTEPVLRGNTLYNSILDDPTGYIVKRGETYVRFPAFDRIVARDMSKPQWRLLLTPSSIVRRLEFPVRWEVETPHKVLIASGDKIIAGTPGEIITIEETNGKPAITFKASIDGAPVNALVSDDRLIISTNTGKLYCFGKGKPTTVPDHPVERQLIAGKPFNPSFPAGYALVLGWGSGKHPEQLLESGKHQVVVLEPDANLANEKRRELAERGVYGRQIQIITSDHAKLDLSRYWANLVISEDIAPFATKLPKLALDTVRPFTGRLRLPATSDAVSLLKKEAAPRGFSAAQPAGKGVLEFHRTSPPAGYDEWTHETSGPANTFANRDELVKGPLGLLWFSGYIDRFYTPEFHFQHDRAPYPLVSHGRMFLITGKYMSAVDVYTGNFLWKIEMPETERVKWRYMDSRVYSRPYDRNYVVTPDTLYIIFENEIHKVSTETGELLGKLTIPDGISGPADDMIWTEIRIAGDHLCCVVGDTLACLDRHTGELVWKRKSTLDGTSYALGGESIFAIDYVRPPGIYQAEKTPTKESVLFRLDRTSGKESWATKVEHATVPEQNPKQKKLWLLPITPGVIYNAKHQKAIVVVNRMSYHAFDAESGSKDWEHLGDFTRTAHALHIAPMPLVADDILFGSTADYKSTALVLDVKTGSTVDSGNWLDYKRGCSRVIGNGNLLTYRNAATEVFDYQTMTRHNFNSVRVGCTANFLPANGVLNAPNFGHGCVCNYPTFASLALIHMPNLDTFKPDIVKAREKERSKPTPETAGVPALPTKPVDVNAFGLIDATLKPAKGGCLFSTANDGVGYALKKTPQPIKSATLRCFFKPASQKGRHGNSYLLLGSSANPDDLIKFMIYHGGRKRLIITGSHVTEQQEEFTLPKKTLSAATVRFDLAAKTVSIEVTGKTLETEITGKIPAITHIGYGGSNSDTFFTELELNPPN